MNIRTFATYCVVASIGYVLMDSIVTILLLHSRVVKNIARREGIPLHVYRTIDTNDSSTVIVQMNTDLYGLLDAVFVRIHDSSTDKVELYKIDNIKNVFIERGQMLALDLPIKFSPSDNTTLTIHGNISYIWIYKLINLITTWIFNLCIFLLVGSAIIIAIL